MAKIASFPFAFINRTKLGSIYRPYALVSIYSKIRKKWQPLEMMIDTGADYSLLPKRYATILGIDLKKDCFREETVGIGGIETIYQYKNLPIKIGIWEKKIPVGFLNKDDLPPILGRLDCLEVLRVIFDKKQSIFED